MNHPKISVIVPVYGVEDHIVECIKSIKKQTFTEFEVLIINDGTTDRSIELASEEIKGDTRFRIIHKKNGGQGSARNLGLDNIEGDFVAFIDSDDYIEADYLKEMYSKITETEADICLCDTFIRKNDKSLIKIHRNNYEKYIENKDYLNGYLYISNWFWDKLYKAELFEKYRFDESIRTFEDAHLMFRLLYNKKITYIHKPLYNYIQHPSSTSNDVKPTYINDRKAISKAQIKFAKEKQINDKKYINFVYLRTFVYFSSVTIARYSSNYKYDIKKLIEEVDKENFKLSNIQSLYRYDKKAAFSLFLFKYFPILFRIITKIRFSIKD